jgi:hypothetical protein
VEVALAGKVEGFERGGDVPEAEEVFPRAGAGRVEGAELGGEVLVLLKDAGDALLELLEVAGDPGFKGEAVSVGGEVHEFDPAVEGNADVVEGEVAVGNSHVVEEGVDPEKLLDQLVEEPAVALEGLGFGVEGLREVLEGLVVVGGAVDGCVDIAGEARESGVLFLEFEEEGEGGGERELRDAKHYDPLLAVLVPAAHLAVDAPPIQLRRAVADYILPDLLLIAPALLLVAPTLPLHY